jgi:CAAX protease family protein
MGKRPPVESLRIDRPRFERNLLLAYAVLYIGLSWATGRLILARPWPFLGATSLTYQTWYVFGFKIGGLLILPAIGMRLLGYRFRDIAGARPRSGPTLLAAAIGYGAGFSLNLSHWKPIGAVVATGALEDAPLRIGLGIVLPLFCAGIPEEVTYRALLQTRLEATWGRFIAILVSNTLFTAGHLPTRYFLADGAEGTAGDLRSVLLGTGVPVFVVGLILSLLWDRYRKLVPLIAAHWGVDTLPAISALLQVDLARLGH